MKERENAISFVRAIAMLLIVLCHFFQFYDHPLAWWFNTGVYIFLFISGFLYGKKEIADPVAFWKKSFARIIVFYWLYLLLVLPVYVLLLPDRFSSTAFIKAFLGAGTIPGLEHFWYISYILFCYLITPLLDALSVKMLKKSLSGYLFRASLLCAAVFILLYVYDSYFNPIRISCYLFGFFAAKALHHYEQLSIAKLGYIVIPLGILANMLRAILEVHFESRITGSIYKVYALYANLSNMLLGITLFLALYLLYMYAAKPDGVLQKLLRFTDKYSYQIFICHHIFILGDLSLLQLRLPLPVETVIVLSLTLVCALLLKHAGDFVIHKISIAEKEMP